MNESAPPATAAISPELPFGALLQGGRYEIHRKLGRGGFGITYAATDRRLHRDVAIKELCFGAATRVGGRLVPPPHEAEAFAAAKGRFLREAAVLARFSHPNVVRIYEVFEEADTAYLVMELLDGRTLYRQVTDGGALPEANVLEIAARCGDALSVLHSGGVLHRDLNPSNVVLTPKGRVVLIDFGLAREFADDATTPMTRIVTPGYAAPEQYDHAGRLGPPTDVFGLAATLYCALTGRAPVPLGGRGRGAAFVAPRMLNPAVSKFVSDAVLDGLELDAGHRPRSIEEFLGRLGLGTPSATHTQIEGGTRPYTAPVPEAPPRFVAPAPLPAPPPPMPVPPQSVPGRSKVVGPAVAIVAALGAIVPVATFALLMLVVLPAIATTGDAIVFVRMRRLGDRLHWRHRAALWPYVPMRFVRNVGRVIYAGVPALLIAAATVAASLLLDSMTSTFTAEAWVLRIGGATAAVVLCAPVFRDRVKFRAAVVGDWVVDRSLDEGALTSFGMTLWIVTALVVAIAVGLRPDLWPFGD